MAENSRNLRSKKPLKIQCITHFIVWSVYTYVLTVCPTDENINGKNSKSAAFWSSLNSDSDEFTYELMRLLYWSVFFFMRKSSVFSPVLSWLRWAVSYFCWSWAVCVRVRYRKGREREGIGMYVTEEWLPCWKFKMKHWDQRQKLVNSNKVITLGIGACTHTTRVWYSSTTV